MHIEVFTKGCQLPELAVGSVLQSAPIFRAIEGNRHCKPYMLVAYDGNGEELGHLIVIRYSRFTILPPFVKSRYIINGDGVYSSRCTDREAVFAKFIEKVLKIAEFHHVYIKAHNIDDSRFAYGTLSSNGFVPMRDRRLYISLHSKPPQERLSRAYKAHIRKAEAAGVTLRRATGDDEINEALIMMKNFYRNKTRKRLPSTECLYRMLHNDDGTLSDNARMFLVIYKDRTIGCSICLYEKGRALLAYSCGLRKRFPLQFPGIMAIWAAITDADRQGYEHFEFLEVRGLSRLRKSFLGTIGNFGGKDVSTLRWYHFKLGWLNKFLRWIYV